MGNSTPFWMCPYVMMNDFQIRYIKDFAFFS